MENSELKEAARRTVEGCLAVRPGETVTVVTDAGARVVGEALTAAAAAADAEAILAVMKPRRINGEEPPAPIAALMRASDALLLPTTVSLSHTRARKEASEAGARGASMPGVTPEMMARTMNVDYDEVAAATERLAAQLESTTSFHLTSPRGTDITINVAGQKFSADTGLLGGAGAFGNLPAGEVCAGPTMEASSGVAVFDGSFAGIGLLAEPIRITFEEGVATALEGGAEARALRELIEPFGRGGFLLAEIGIGTHPTAEVTGAVLEDEKVRGTVHLALGNNVGFGGNNDVAIHLDGVILTPTLTTDTDAVIIKEGVLK